jgi:hypothetical protein
MKRTLILVLAAGIFLCACHYRIYVNGEFRYKSRRVHSNSLPRADTPFVLEPGDAFFPDSARFIENITVRSPDTSYITEPIDNLLTNQFKVEAAKAGANLIRITKKQGIGFNRLKYAATLYSLPEPYRSANREALDSIRLRHREVCQVRLRFYADKRSNFTIYFNDSLVLRWPFPHQAPVDPGYREVSFALPASGQLRCGYEPLPINNSRAWIVYLALRGSRHLEAGWDYYFWVGQTVFGAYLILLTDSQKWPSY